MSWRRFFFPGRGGGKSSSTNGPVDPEGWQVGDQAECIVHGRWYHYPSLLAVDGPKAGAVLRVVAVTVKATSLDPQGTLFLTFAAWPGQDFHAPCFRKVRPRADEATPAEAEFTELVRRQPKPASPAAPSRKPIPEFQ